MQTLHGYTVDETQWKSKGGGGQCNIAKKGGKEYFIKRLAFPRYPDSDNFKGAFKQQKIDICNDWYRRRQEIIRAIPGSGTGTTVKPIEYFREGPCYYEVANLIDVTSIPYDEIYKESKEDKARVKQIGSDFKGGYENRTKNLAISKNNVANGFRNFTNNCKLFWRQAAKNINQLIDYIARKTGRKK